MSIHSKLVSDATQCLRGNSLRLRNAIGNHIEGTAFITSAMRGCHNVPDGDNARGKMSQTKILYALVPQPSLFNMSRMQCTDYRNVRERTGNTPKNVCIQQVGMQYINFFFF